MDCPLTPALDDCGPLHLELQRAAKHVGIVLSTRDIGMPYRRAKTL